MSIKKTYALHDHITSTFLNALTFINDGDAIRWFGTVVNSEEKTNISEHPQQYTLFRLADFNDVTGTYEPRDWEQNPKDSQIDKNMIPKQIITGNEVQLEKNKTFTVDDLISMLKLEINKDNQLN